MLQCGAKKVNPVEPFVTSLPVAAVLPELLTALKTAPQVLLSAPTGAGKSTWLPLQLLQQGPVAGKILLLEPRRLAARNVAQRLAEALNEKPGETVGYRMRAQSCVGPRTRLEVVTEGVLTRMIQRDPELRGVGLVILDEFHERSLQADLALALLLDIQQGLRDDLRLLIMSATLDNDRLCQRLPDAPTIVSEGRAFPVERRYQPLAAHLRFDEAVAMATAELLRNENGSLLLFLPGVGEIQRVHEHLASRVGSDVLLCPLYGALSLEAQRKAIVPAPAGMRKVVLATNIAETSLTIEGIRLVVDSAQERVARFDARTGLTRLDHEDNPPALAVRMQEMFGEASTPTLAQGRVPLVLELLSPAQRPLQITRDLSAFWQGAYREVQKEMKGRYPKHVWPDDPANTAPTRRTKKYS